MQNGAVENSAVETFDSPAAIDWQLQVTPYAPPAANQWGPDMFGPGFSAYTLPLADDGEGDSPVATLVRHEPFSDPHMHQQPDKTRFVVLSLHGWNDYFLNPGMARSYARLGGAFYALDLRRYGRSLRPEQIPFWCTRLETYDEEIDASLEIIRRAHPQLPVLMLGHSTGGLIACLWAHHHPGQLAGLILNSPWLELQTTPQFRSVSTPVIHRLAQATPHAVIIPTQVANDLGPVEGDSFFKLYDGWDQSKEGPLPEGANPADPYYSGWQTNWDWKWRKLPNIQAGWASAILTGHQHVRRGLNIDCPLLVLTSKHSHLTLTYGDLPERDKDTVIDVRRTRARANELGQCITQLRIADAVHDIYISRPSVRNQVVAQVDHWLASYTAIDFTPASEPEGSRPANFTERLIANWQALINPAS